MRATADQPANASRRWMLARALGLQTTALQRQGQTLRRASARPRPSLFGNPAAPWRSTATTKPRPGA